MSAEERLAALVHIKEGLEFLHAGSMQLAWAAETDTEGESLLRELTLAIHEAHTAANRILDYLNASLEGEG